MVTSLTISYPNRMIKARLVDGWMSPDRAMKRRLPVTATHHTDSTPTQTADVRVCDVCGRPVAARDKNEYTVARARLVADRGLCVCSTQAPAHAPSLI
jgi:hypothetical protein